MEIVEINPTELRERIKQISLPFIAAQWKQARFDCKLSHDVIGERMGGVSRQHLIKLEGGKHRPGPEMLTRYAAATGKPIAFFVPSEVDTPTIPFPGSISRGDA